MLLVQTPQALRTNLKQADGSSAGNNPLMTKPISRSMHGLLTDYPYVLIVGMAPFWLEVVS